MTSISPACCSTPSKKNWLSSSLVCLLLASCQASNQAAQLDFFALGTEVSVSLYGVSEQQLDAASERLQDYFADVGHNWYPWRPGELQQVNAAIADGRPIQVSAPLARLVRRAADLETRSGNTFNAGLGRLTEHWGLHDFVAPATLPAADSIAELLTGGASLERIEWQGNKIVTAPPVIKIDLGGIAKGAILERSAGILQELGIANGIINIGGDLLVLGEVNGRPARIGVRSPLHGRPIAALDVSAGETVVTSGNYERFVVIDGQRFTHVLDPRTGYPVEHTASVTVVHTDAILADAAATALMVGGAGQFDALVEQLELEFAVLITAGGDLCLTPAMQERLDWTEAAPKG